MKPTKCIAKEKKMRQEKQRKRGGEKVKSNSLETSVLPRYLRLGRLPRLVH